MIRAMYACCIAVSLLLFVLFGCNGGAEKKDEPSDVEQPIEPADEDPDENGDPEESDEDPYNDDRDTDAENGHDRDPYSDDEEADPDPANGNGEESDESGDVDLPAEPSAYPDWTEDLQQDLGTAYYAFGYGHTESEALKAGRAALHEFVAATVKAFLKTIDYDPYVDAFDPELVDSYADTIVDDVIDGAETVSTEELEHFTFVKLRLNFESVVDTTIGYFGDWFQFGRDAEPLPERAEVILSLSEFQEDLDR